MQQAPGAEVVVVAVDRRLPAHVAGVDLRAAELDRDAPVLADRLRRGGERAAKRLHLLPLLVAQLPHLVLGRDRRVERVHVQAQRVGEDRVEKEEHRDAAAQADLVCRHADGLVADLGHEHVGTHVVEDPFERTESADGAGDAPRLGAAVAGPVGPVHVADVRQVVGLLDPADLRFGIGRLADRGSDVAQAARVDTARLELLGRRPRDGHVADVVAVRAQLLADARVELALVGLQRGEEETHRHPGSSPPASSRYTASWRCANSSQVNLAACSGPPAAGRSRTSTIPCAMVSADVGSK